MILNYGIHIEDGDLALLKGMADRFHAPCIKLELQEERPGFDGHNRYRPNGFIKLDLYNKELTIKTLYRFDAEDLRELR
jgi:hypothetical protein